MRTEQGGYRRDHLRALVQRVEVDAKEVRIMERKSVLLRALVAASSAKTAGFGVPSFVCEMARQCTILYDTAVGGAREASPPAELAQSRSMLGASRRLYHLQSVRRECMGYDVQSIERDASSKIRILVPPLTAKEKVACLSAVCHATGSIQLEADEVDHLPPSFDFGCQMHA